MNNIYLTGFMSSGKTVVSGVLAKITGRELLDTDEITEKRLNMKITDIFEQFGEEYFRDEETKTLIEVSAHTNAIISTGGGMVLRAENRKIMKNTGVVVALLPDFSVIESRLSVARSTRPLLMEETEKIRKRFNDRLPLYKDCHISVIPESTPEATAEKILNLIEKEGQK